MLEANVVGIERREVVKVATQLPATSWPNGHLLDLLKIEHPLIQAPMGLHTSPAMPVAVSRAGGLGSFPCSAFTPAQLRDVVGKICAQTDGSLNLNFFSHASRRDPVLEAAWLKQLAPYYAEFGIDPPTVLASGRPPFGAEMCDVVVELKPRVVSFHWGLPESSLVNRLKAAGCMIFSSATTVAEARWLEDHGVDAVIAQGLEAGGHRGMFLTTDLASQLGTLALVPQVVDAVKVPVIAAGGIADGRGIAAMLGLGAAAVQMGTAYLLCPEATTSSYGRAALKSAKDNVSVLSNVLTGRPARVFVNRIVREVGPLAAGAPPFPLGIAALKHLRAKAESQGSSDFSGLYGGQGAALGREFPAGELTLAFAKEALERIRATSPSSREAAVVSMSDVIGR
jgi:nitronate monooxygenase